MMADSELNSKSLEASKPPTSGPADDVDMIAGSGTSPAEERKSKRKIVTLPISGKV